MTTRLTASIARLAQVLPTKYVAQWFGVCWETVKQIDQRALVARLGRIDLDDVRCIEIDELAIHRGHRYATVVANPVTRKVQWVGRGRGREDLRPFLALMGPEGRARLEAAGMDMSGAYADEVGAQCPHVAIVYDLFHVVAKDGREVIDWVRVDETNRVAGRATGRGPAQRLWRQWCRRAMPSRLAPLRATAHPVSRGHHRSLSLPAPH